MIITGEGKNCSISHLLLDFLTNPSAIWISVEKLIIESQKNLSTVIFDIYCKYSISIHFCIDK